MRRSAIGLVLALSLLGATCGGGSVEPCVDDCIPIPSGEAVLAAAVDLPPGPGPHPVLVVVHGSGEAVRGQYEGAVADWLSVGVGLARYDKRGVGQSTGSYRGVNAGNSIEAFDTLAGDVVAVVDYLAQHPDVDADRIGLLGASQAGWLMPLAASRSDEIDFIISISGAASSVGVSDRFDRIAESDRSDAEIAADLASFDGDPGFDPAPVLAALDIPVLWEYGGRDESNPTGNDIAIIERIAAETGADFTIELFPGGDHDLIDADSGRPFNTFRPMVEWLTRIGVIGD